MARPCSSTTSASARTARPPNGRGRLTRNCIDDRDQVLDPMTAYQITSMMEGVVQRGTATILKSLNRPIAGKTGTTNDEKGRLVHRLHAGSRVRRLSWLRHARSDGQGLHR